MSVFYIFGVALALSMDALAVSIGLSLSKDGLRGARAVRLASLFGLFQFMMPIAGWAAGAVGCRADRRLRPLDRSGLACVRRGPNDLRVLP